MKSLRLLNKKIIIKAIIIFFLPITILLSEEAEDIWNLSVDENNKVIINKTIEKNDPNNFFNNDKNKKILPYSAISQDSKIVSSDLEIFGLYDPIENDFKFDMWTKSDGNKIENLIKKIDKLNLSEDAKQIYNKVILTNALPPKNNITSKQFNNYKISWLIKHRDLEQIKKFIIKNNFSTISPDLIKFYLDYYLSLADLKNACEIFEILKYSFSDEYILKYKIYCLYDKDLKEQAQLNFDLLKEDGFNDKFYEDNFLFLMGYKEKTDYEVSDKNLLDFHLSHRVDPNFKYEPSDKTSKLIWKYLASSNLLTDIATVDLQDSQKIISIEKATHSENYDEEELFNLYKRFKFGIDQLLTVEDSFKLLSPYEGRALLYQGILINNDVSKKIRLIEILFNEFKKSQIENAFNKHLINLLKELNEDEVPSDYLTFYQDKLKLLDNIKKDIKFNNKIFHQSKLLNYFIKDIKNEKIEKDLESILKKLSKDKNYYFTTKDSILIESLIYDGIIIPEKYKSVIETDRANIPTDIQVMLNDFEMGLILLRLVEIIGEDNLNDLGSESQYFIITTLNKLNSDKLRDELILKILPFRA